MSNFAELARVEKFIGQPMGPSNRLKKHAFLGAAVIALMVGTGFFLLHSKSGDAAVPAPQAMPVTTQALAPQTVHPFAQFSGRINAVDYAEIRPQVSGRITEIRFHDGQKVKAGDILFVIDPRPYQAAVAKAEGDLASAINNARLAKTERERGDRLMKAQALAQESYRPARQRRWRGAGRSAVRPGGPGGSPAECRLCLYKGADLGPHQPGGNHAGQSGRWHHHGAANFWPPSSPTMASMPISKSTSRPT